MLTHCGFEIALPGGIAQNAGPVILSELQYVTGKETLPWAQALKRPPTL